MIYIKYNVFNTIHKIYYILWPNIHGFFPNSNFHISASSGDKEDSFCFLCSLFIYDFYSLWGPIFLVFFVI